MVTAVVAACAVLAAGVLAVLAVHRSRRESERKLEIVFERVKQSSEAISTSVEQAVARMVDAQRERFAAAVARLRRARRRPRRRSRRADGRRRRRRFASKAPADAWSSHRSARARESELAERAFALPARDRFALRRSTGRTARRARPTTRASGPRSLLHWRRARDSGNTGGLLVDVTRVSTRSTRRRCTGCSCRVRHGLGERAPLRGRRSPAASRSHDRCRQPPWLRGGARPGSRSGAPDRAPAVDRAGWDQRHRDSDDDRRQRERRPGRPTPHASHAKERHLVQTRRPRVRDPDAGDEGVGRTCSDRHGFATRRSARWHRARRRSRWGTWSGGPTSQSRRSRRASRQP